MLRVDPNRVIEINNLGRFYVMGMPNYGVLYIPDLFAKERSGWIVVESELIPGFQGKPLSLNRLFKMTNDGKLIPALFKSLEMAEEVAYACNRIRV